jgi:hypothetical protein
MFTAEQQRDALEREIRKRKQVYPRLIATGRMTRQKAKYEIDIMQSILDEYQHKATAERLI